MAVGMKRWWVNVHVGGVWWSEDAGETWHGAVEPGADVHEVADRHRRAGGGSGGRGLRLE